MTAPIGYPERFGALINAEKLTKTSLPEAGQPLGQAVGKSFSEHVEGFVSGVDSVQKAGQVASESFASGKSNDIHGTMIAVEEAEISLRLLANVRNRVVDMYREVMRMGS
jgi:flagellar hook-basal body complex protein FliE